MPLNVVNMNDNIDLKTLFRLAQEEIEQEEQKRMTPEELRLNEITKSLLLVEKECKVSGKQQTATDRVDRLLQILDKESF